MSELEEAGKKQLRIKELQDEIEKCKGFQSSCKAANDNIGDKKWCDYIKRLKNEKHNLDGEIKYTNLSLFCQVVKTMLTKEQYHECWRKVEEILENPKLMQDV